MRLVYPNDSVMSAHRKSKGFTLVEIIIVGGIVGLVSIVLTQVIFTAARSNTKVDLTNNIKAEGDFAVEQIARTIRGALSVVTCASGMNAITVTSPANVTTTFACSGTAPNLRISSTVNGVTDYVTGQSYTLNPPLGTGCTLVFDCTKTATIPVYTTVLFSFTMKQKLDNASGAEAASVFFSSEVRLRNVQ